MMCVQVTVVDLVIQVSKLISKIKVTYRNNVKGIWNQAVVTGNWGQEKGGSKSTLNSISNGTSNFILNIDN